jgi:phosphoglucomutase
MITDKLLRVSEDQALTTTAVSTDTIDLSVARDIGEFCSNHSSGWRYFCEI